jgi:hypothetical protein
MSGNDHITVEVVRGLITLDTMLARDALRVTAPGIPPFTMDIPEPEEGRDWQDTIYDAITAEIDKRTP